jgi:hypothetical protein
MFCNKTTLGLISVLLIGFILTSCVSYKPRTVEVNRRSNYYRRDAHLIWPGSTESDLYMKDMSFAGNTLSGTVYQKPTPKAQRNNGFMANLYLDSSVVYPDSLPCKLAITTDKILKLEVYDSSVGKTIVYTFLSATAVAAVILVIFLATKESCPFIYSFNGSTYDFIGEIYSGAILPGLERDDYLPLPGLKPVNASYQLKMTNEVQEIQHTNMTELLVVDHSVGTNVLIDKYGKCHSYQALQAPILAHDADANNILDLISSRDSLRYLGGSNNHAKASDEMYLTFDRPNEEDEALLVFRGKNSFWLDYTMGQFFNMFGSKYAKWFKNQKTSKNQIQPNWALEQDIPLSVFLREHGEWKFVDYYYVVGPMADKDMVMPIDISNVGSDQIEIKLESGYLFWETDYVALGVGSRSPVYQEAVPISKAVSHDAKDLSGILKVSDKKYFTMPQIGNYAVLNFAVPALHQDCERTVFLHSRGHYEVLRKPSGNPDVKYLAAR